MMIKNLTKFQTKLFNPYTKQLLEGKTNKPIYNSHFNYQTTYSFRSSKNNPN